MNKNMTTPFIMIIALVMSACNTSEQTSNDNSAAVASTETASPAAVEQNSYKNIDAKTFMEKMADSSTLVIDVRTPGEVQAGYIKGADLFIDINGADFDKKIAELDSTKTYLVYCRSGARSARASSIMVQKGFGSVYNLSGGIMNYPGDIETR